jgi:hypothetical protein
MTDVDRPSIAKTLLICGAFVVLSFIIFFIADEIRYEPLFALCILMFAGLLRYSDVLRLLP